MSRLRTLLILAALCAPAAVRAQPSARELRVQALSGGSRTLAGDGGATTAVFWRADCGPCMLELADLSALRVAAKPGRVVLVGLQPADDLRRGLRKLGLADADSLRATDDPARVLTAFGGAPPRLPLAVAFDRDGRVCGRRTGYLGRNQVKAWARACGGADARR